jgi:hypothetical protein
MHRNPRLGTRGSPLALIQARKVASALEVAERWPAGHVEIVPITTSGDRIADRPLAEVGGKGLWTKELDAALLRRRRFHRPFDEGCRGRPAGGDPARRDPPASLSPGQADRRQRSLDELKKGAVSAPRRRGGPPSFSPPGPTSRSCRFAAMSRLG